MFYSYFSKTDCLPFGLKLKNQSFFCSLVDVSLQKNISLICQPGEHHRAHMSVVVHPVPYALASSSKKICTFWPLGVFWVRRCSPAECYPSSFKSNTRKSAAYLGLSYVRRSLIMTRLESHCGWTTTGVMLAWTDNENLEMFDLLQMDSILREKIR